MAFASKRGGRSVVAGFFVALCAFAHVAFAQEALPDFYKEPGIYPNRDYVNQHVTENVDPFTGALQIHSTDVYLPGAGGFDLKVVRSFNSNRINPTNPADLNTSTLAGMGWTVHFGRVLKNRNTFICLNSDGGTAIGDNAVIELPDGSRQVLAFTPTGSPLMLTTQRWRAECIGAGTGLAVYSPDGIRYDMTQQVQEVGGASSVNAWYTTQITDRNGNTATVNYAAAATPQISSVTTSDGRSITFNYADSGLLSRRITSIVTGGRTWTYGYTAVSGVSGRYFLTSVSRPDSPSTSWGYAYNTVVGSDNANNYQMLRVTYPQGGTMTYGYGYVYFDSVSNPSSRSVVVSTKSTSDGGNWSFAYTPGSANVYDTTSVTTPAGNITYRHVGANYATSGSVWRIGLLMQKTIGSLQTENYTWGSQQISAENNLRQGAFPSRIDTEVYAPILTQRSIVRDGATYTTSFSSHDAYGNPATITESGPNGGSRTTNLTYYINTSKWIVNQVDDETTVGVGSVVRGWDANGNLLSESRDGVNTGFTRYANGDIQTTTNARSFTSTFSNYFRGIPQSESHPEGVNITRAVSDAGNVTWERNGELQTTSFQYDGLNRVTNITPPAGNPTTISYTATSKTATRGSLQQVITLNGFGRVTNITTGGQAIASSYDSLGRKTFGSIIGFPTVGHNFLYDVLNRVTRITHNTDASYRTFTYSSSGGTPTLAVRDERNFITTHSYRAYGDPDKPLVMNIAAPVAAASVSIARNGRGLVTSATQSGVTRQFNYNTSYFLTSTVQPEVGTTTYGRDAVGNMTTKQVGSSGTTTFDYDGRNRLWRVTYPGGSPSQVTNVYWRTDKLRTVTNAVATRTYGYDSNQNLTTESLVVDGLTLAATYNYNANDQLASIVYPVLNRTVTFSPNALGRPTNIAVPAGSMLAASFWPNGQVYDIAYAGGSRVTYGQNTREWLNTITVKTGDGVSRIASTLSYDVAGNVYNIADSVDASYNRTLAFDGINRLTTTTGPWGTGSVTYDGRGNVLSQVLGSETRTNSYDAQNRLSSVERNFGPSGGTSAYAISYDVYGNAVSAASDTYTFDNASNIVSTSSGRAFAYDGTNTRVRTSYAGVTTYEFRSAHGLLLAEWRKQSGFYDALKEHMHLAGKEVAEQRTEFLGSTLLTPSWMFLQPDANGSPISSTWAGGGLLFKENYQPYGLQLNGTGTAYTNRAFAGKTQDKSDLIYMGGRYYNPLAARFLSIDPQEADPSDLHSLNRYAYANNNPYRYVDPDGHTPVDLAFFAIDAVKLGVAIYSGAGVGAAAFDLGMSAVGVFSPVPGTGQALKTLRTAEKVVEGLKAADHAAGAARLAERGVEAGAAAEKGVVYLRTNAKTGEKYVGQAKSQKRYEARQSEHDRNLGTEHDFEILGRAPAGKKLDVLEESAIRAQGGIKKEGGTLANKRHQMSDANFRKHGGSE
ncbi:MAG: RHS repeat-associated core domain-containing protein [Proteobacteria bacterium]|nr:RHS repeat-associated core domain-containing protein [Pseudomonadota bacterium]